MPSSLSAQVFDGQDRRTIQGARLRATLESIASHPQVIPAGKREVIYGVATTDGAQVGWAKLTASGWEIDSAIGVALGKGVPLDPFVRFALSR